MTPFSDYDKMCPKCGSENIQGEGARGEDYLWSCQDCGYESISATRFKKSRVQQMKRWKGEGHKKRKEIWNESSG